MNRPVVLSCVVVLLFGLSGIANATTVNFGGSLIGGEFTSSQAGAAVETFDAKGTPGTPFVQTAWSWLGNYGIYKDSLSGAYAAPAAGPPYTADASYFMVVPKVGNPVPQSVTLKLDRAYSYFGIWWGSIDTYNSIEFKLGDTSVYAYSGSSVPPANGDWFSANTNRYVNFTDLVFDKVVLTSTGVAFEFDNVAVANPVPIPGAAWLLGSGLLGLLGFRRKSVG